MSTRINTVLMTLLVATFAVGCSSPPTERADAARARLEALGPDARTYAPNEFAEAQETVARLEAELEAQQQGFAMSRSYDRTEELIDEVDAAAERVESAIEAGRRRAEAETEAEAARQSEIDAQAVADEQAAAEQAEEASTPALAPGQVALQRSVNVDGKPLSAGTYTLRLGDEQPAKDAAIRAGRWVEFVSNGSVAGRALAVVIPDDEISEVASSSYPRNEAWVSELRGGEYVRVWLHRDGMHYLLHLPTS